MKAKVSALMRWVGPLAIVGGVLALISDQVGLVVHLPEMGYDSMGYHAVGSGIFLFIVTLLFIGMFGLYATPDEPGAAKVVEYGDAQARYILVVDEPEAESLPAERTPRVQNPRRDGLPRDAAVRRHRTVHRAGR